MGASLLLAIKLCPAFYEVQDIPDTLLDLSSPRRNRYAPSYDHTNLGCQRTTDWSLRGSNP